MINDEEPLPPPYFKMLEFEDLLKYATKTNKIIDINFFGNYGFLPSETKWLFNNKLELIEMNNEEVLKNMKKVVEKLKKENEELKEQVNAISNTNSIGWKGISGIKVTELKDEWHVVEYRKTKHEGKKYSNMHYIPKSNVKDVYKIINMLTDSDNRDTGYRQVAQSLITKHNLDIDIEAFNGGCNRSKYLFPLYYYPIKILEKKGYIKYSGRGKITRLKFNNIKL